MTKTTNRSNSVRLSILKNLWLFSWLSYFPQIMRHKSSPQCFKQPTTKAYRETVESSLHTQVLHFNIILLEYVCLSQVFLHFRVSY
jgi:hypothetical protein